MDEFRFEAALAAALAVMHTLSVRPGLSRQQRLATVTYRILDAIAEVEARRADGSPLSVSLPDTGGISHRP